MADELLDRIRRELQDAANSIEPEDALVAILERIKKVESDLDQLRKEVRRNARNNGP